MSPAANAPTIGASPTFAAAHDKNRQNEIARVSKTPLVSSRPAPRSSRGTRKSPITTEPIRNATDFSAITPTSSIDSTPPVPAALIAPATTASTRSASTSSITAAPRIMRASRVASFPKSLKTRAVMPRLVRYEVRRQGPPQKKGRDYTKNSNQQRRPADFEHLFKVRLETDFK